jgi:hypothetical protein
VHVDESSGVATGVLPDLTIKEMCLASGPTVPSETLRVLVETRKPDADPFKQLIQFKPSSDDVGDWHVDTVAGLKAREERLLQKACVH